ncbi:hypothetical protein B1C78_09785 [Thioalkalivibrio denitrificans]|uniref:Uncharacterized protein n=1 Tax=Thioalkalivibrio denitrificans TaxID=108003 RepID=A0A1V3NFK5_9GAMM|nr:hypothetical protein [Thioalkalivibrio denitrificans]OOG23815.1 hypothetical protein B1C78_09785 [Thioalkalivibrio denitrificans]
MKLVKLIKLNNLQYNVNRDPEAYRRPVNEEFRLQVLLNGSGTAKARFVGEGETLGETNVNLPGTFECRFSYDTPGTRVGTLIIEGNDQTFRQDIRIDVTEHAWVG